MRRGTQDRPRFSEDWLVAVLDSLSEGVIALAADGHVQAANPAAEELLGFRISECRGEPWDRLSWRDLVDEDRNGLKDEHPVAATLRDGQPRETTVVGLLADDTVRWLALATHVLPSEDPITAGGVVVSFQDRTDRVQAEHELQRFLEMLREFMATATHDLRSPLTTILGYANMLAADWADMSDPERERAVRSVLRQAEALGRLVDDLSVVARLEAGGISADPREANVRELVDLALDGLTELDAFEIDVPSELGVRVDPDHGRRMLLNLVENATKYGHAPYEVTARPAGPNVELTVADRGRGVPDTFVPRLFERFTRASEGPGGGTGLGLAIVAGLAQMNGGDVRYEHNAPSGACFTLTLPRP